MSVLRRFTIPLVAALLAGCGGAGAVATPCAPLSTPAPPQASAAGVSATASAGSVAPGGSIDFIATVHGPLSFMTNCGTGLQLRIEDGNGVSVDTTTSTTAPPSPQCGSVTLGEGQTMAFRSTWTPDATLPSGIYSVWMVVGDRPALRLAIPVRTLDGGC